MMGESSDATLGAQSVSPSGRRKESHVHLHSHQISFVSKPYITSTMSHKSCFESLPFGIRPIWRM